MKSFTSTVAGCQIRYHEFPGPGVPLVFIHGLGCASSYEYPRVVLDPGFSPRRALLIDLPGSGFSEKPTHYSYRTTDQAKAVVEWLTALELKHCWLYGHSMGGSIAIEVATLLRDTLSGLVVSEPNFHHGGGQFSREIAACSENEFVTEEYQRLIDNEKGPWAGCLSSNSATAVWRGASSLVAGIEPSWLSLFVGLNMPKQLLFGELSLPDSDFDVITMRGIDCRVIPSAGHSMSWENPAALAQALSNFCAAHER